MIAYVRGTLVEKEPTRAVIEAGGVGYELLVPLSTYEKLPRTGSEAKLLAYHCVREDDELLFGFASEDERELFAKLTSVSGVGPKAGISILSTLTPEALVNAIAGEDSRSIAQAPGIGAKTAARIVLELHDKVAKSYLGMAQTAIKKPVAGSPAKGNLSDARDALIVLGYSRQEVSSALSAVDPSKDTEEIIRDALAILMR